MNINRLPKIPNRPKRSKDENAIEIADKLHSILCKLNHTDCCSWLYSDWKRPCDTRKKYLTKAYKMLDETDIVTIKKVLKHL